MGKLIKLRPTPNLIEKGREILSKLSDEDGTAVIAVVTHIIIEDVKAGLAGDSEDRPVFELIDQEFRRAVGHCYFCNKEIDANETEFNLDTHLCLFCQLKVANILTAVGVDPRGLFPDIGERFMQKTKLRL